jgi:glutamine phosphoribosylpyrophosphate amidotransferase
MLEKEMYGIIGYAKKRDAAPLLMDGLRRLEYRGYDSAGICTPTRYGVLTGRYAWRSRLIWQEQSNSLPESEQLIAALAGPAGNPATIQFCKMIYAND